MKSNEYIVKAGYYRLAIFKGFALTLLTDRILTNYEIGQILTIIFFSHTKDHSQYFIHIVLMFSVLGNNIIENKQNSDNDF